MSNIRAFWPVLTTQTTSASTQRYTGVDKPYREYFTRNCKNYFAVSFTWIGHWPPLYLYYTLWSHLYFNTWLNLASASKRLRGNFAWFKLGSIHKSVSYSEMCVLITNMWSTGFTSRPNKHSDGLVQEVKNFFFGKLEVFNSYAGPSIRQRH